MNKLDTPYCRECGYDLTGLTESPRCPECGGAVVDVLVRASMTKAGRRYRSEATLFGLPLVAIASGPHGAEQYGAPVGIIAMGDRPRGVIAIGGAPVGFIACGGIARGLIAIGGVAIGGVSIGGVSVGVLGIGGLIAGIWALGGSGVALATGIGGNILKLSLF